MTDFEESTLPLAVLRAQSMGMVLRIYPKGQAALNYSAYAALDSPPTIVFIRNMQTREIAIRAGRPDDIATYKVGTARTFSMLSFLRWCGVEEIPISCLPGRYVKEGNVLRFDASALFQSSPALAAGEGDAQP